MFVCLSLPHGRYSYVLLTINFQRSGSLCTNRWKNLILVHKPKQELQRDQSTNVSSNITNTTIYEKLRSDNSNQEYSWNSVKYKKVRKLSQHSSTSKNKRSNPRKIRMCTKSRLTLTYLMKQKTEFKRWDRS